MAAIGVSVEVCTYLAYFHNIPNGMDYWETLILY